MTELWQIWSFYVMLPDSGQPMTFSPAQTVQVSGHWILQSSESSCLSLVGFFLLRFQFWFDCFHVAQRRRKTIIPIWYITVCRDGQSGKRHRWCSINLFQRRFRYNGGALHLLYRIEYRMKSCIKNTTLLEIRMLAALFACCPYWSPWKPAA